MCMYGAKVRKSVMIAVLRNPQMRGAQMLAIGLAIDDRVTQRSTITDGWLRHATSGLEKRSLRHMAAHIGIESHLEESIKSTLFFLSMTFGNEKDPVRGLDVESNESDRRLGRALYIGIP